MCTDDFDQIVQCSTVRIFFFFFAESGSELTSPLSTVMTWLGRQQRTSHSVGGTAAAEGRHCVVQGGPRRSRAVQGLATL